MKIQYVIYRRVSTARQGISGLGLDAQESLIKQFLNADSEVMGEFTEIESGKRSQNRPELAKAIALCQTHGYTLLVATISRLARNLHFITSLQQSKIQFTCADFPSANPLMIHLLSAFAEHEASEISNRTKRALEQAKLRGVKLGNPRPENALNLAHIARKRGADSFAGQILPVIEEIRQKANVTSYRGIAEILNVRGLKTHNGKLFAAQSVKNILVRSELYACI